MNPTIDLGNVKIDGYKFAINANAILGTRNAGKTWTGKYFAESLMDINVPIIVIDPVGRWRYMQQENPNNTQGKSYPVIVVGRDSDVELSIDTIEDVIMLALRTRSSLVIDLYHKDYDESKNDIVALICEKLFYENESHGLRTLIVEESADFLGQTQKKSVASVWLEKLTRYSGNCKLGILFLNQNSESLSKAVLKLCKGMILGIQNESNSIKMIRKWLAAGGVKNSEEVSESLPNLTSGQFWVWATYLENNTPVLTKIPMIKSNHPSREDISSNDVLPSEDNQIVIERMQQFAPVQNSFSTYDTIMTEEVSQEEETQVTLNVNWENITGMDKRIMELASLEKYGTTTVKTFIDNLFLHGYTRFVPVVAGIGRLESSSGSVQLNSKIECQYAETLSRIL